VGIFPLTLALSLGEREQLSMCYEHSSDSSFIPALPIVLPLPEGEGGVRGKATLEQRDASALNVAFLLPPAGQDGFEPISVICLLPLRKSLIWRIEQFVPQERKMPSARRIYARLSIYINTFFSSWVCKNLRYSGQRPPRKRYRPHPVNPS
jgi:hypothetical protein